MLNLDITVLKNEEKENKCVVKLTTTIYKRSRTYHASKNLTSLKKQCKGYNILDEDVNDGGVEDVLSRIINLYDVKDGIYELVTCNEHTDFETGIIGEYDYKLIPV